LKFRHFLTPVKIMGGWTNCLSPKEGQSFALQMSVLDFHHFLYLTPFRNHSSSNAMHKSGQNFALCDPCKLYGKGALNILVNFRSSAYDQTSVLLTGRLLIAVWMIRVGMSKKKAERQNRKAITSVCLNNETYKSKRNETADLICLDWSSVLSAWTTATLSRIQKMVVSTQAQLTRMTAPKMKSNSARARSTPAARDPMK